MAPLPRKPSFWLLSFGAASGSILGYGLIFWLPSFFSRSFGLALDRGRLVLRVDRAGRRRRRHLARRLVRRPLGGERPGAYALVPGIAFLIAAPPISSRSHLSLALGLVLFVIPTCSRSPGSAR